MSKKLFLITMLFSFVVLPAKAQWEWQNPLPQGQNLHSIEFINENEGWAGGEYSTILHTTDGGESWEFQYNGEISIFYDIEFIDSQTGFAAGGYPFINRRIMKTSNGGNDWAEVLGAGMNPVYDLFVLENDTILAAGANGSLLISETNGNSWQTINTGFDFHFRSCWFFNYGNGWIVGDEGQVIRKNDEQGWIQVNPFTDSDLYSVCFIDEQTGFTCGEDGVVFRTENGGNSWSLMPLLTNSILRHIEFISHEMGWITGGHVLFTSDAGRNWTVQQASGVSASHPTAATGYTAGAFGNIFRTSNYGEDWSEISSGFHDEIKDMYFLDERRGWAAENSLPDRHILFTDDGGENWLAIDTNNYLFYAICFTDELHGWAVGLNHIFSTSDGGHNWEIAKYTPGPGPPHPTDVFFTDPLHGWVVTQYDTIYRTINGGNTWEDIPINSYGLNECFFIDKDIGWCVGYISNILKTEDGGLTWTDVSPPCRYIHYNSVFFTDPSNGWIVGDENVILHSRNGGINWESQAESYPRSLNSVVFIDSLNGWICGTYGEIFHTSDGGLTWEKQQSNCWNHLYTICITDMDNGWAAGLYGSIMHTSNGGAVGIKDKTSVLVPSPAFNYPNPFKSSTIIEYELPHDGLVTISIHNNLGVKIETLQQKVMHAGKQTVSWNASHYPAGLYYFIIETPAGISCGKMMIVR